MSTKLGVHNRNLPAAAAAAPASAREPLPMDLLLEIAARCDVTTIIRCAMASKFLRSAILDPAFRRRLELQAAAAGGGGFDPALLFGVSYLTFGASMLPTHRIIHTPSSIQLHPCLQALTLDDSFQPVASRDRLLLLYRYGIFPHPPNIELRVFDTTTALVTCLPMVSTFNAHAFLSVTDGHYELIIMDKRFRFETFSSKRGRWSAARRASSLAGHPRRLDASSRVVGRTVHWLCQRNAGAHCWDGILALDVHAAVATTMKLPPGCLQSRMMTCKHDKHLLLGSVRGRLCLIVAEARGISIWTLTSPHWSPHLTATWSRQLVIGAEEIVRPPGGGCSPLSFVLEGFGERSGAVIIRVDRRDLFRLDLGTKAVTRMHNPGGDASSVTCLFVHETDMASLLKKSF